MRAQPLAHDLEQFSAYLDGQLSPGEKARLDQRLQANPQLRQQLDELAATRALLRSARPYRAPRSFTLSPETARQYARKPLFPALPAFRFSAALSALALIAVLTIEVIGLQPQQFASPAAMQEAAPATTLRTNLAPTLAIEWQTSELPAQAMGGGLGEALSDAPPILGRGGGGDSFTPIPLEGPITLPLIAIENIDSSQKAAPQAEPGQGQADTPILGIPAPGDGGKMITASGTLEEIPEPAIQAPAAPQPQPAAIPVRRAPQALLLLFAAATAVAALIFQRRAAR